MILQKSDRLILWLGRHWILLVSALVGIYALSPFLAPVFMRLGLTLPAKIIYWVYSILCHQLPERSYFLFGQKNSYSLPEIQMVWKNTTNPAVLRQFIGTPQLGWKVAWSDRMVSMYTSLWLFGIIWAVFRNKIKPLPWWGLILFMLPMAVDGVTHTISDIAGLGQGFRDSNLWLAALTKNSLPASFTAGDTWGSFNAWMRLITGVLFGMSIVWAGYPFLNDVFTNSVEISRLTGERRSLLKSQKVYLAGLTKDSASGLSQTNSLDQASQKDR